MGFQICLMSGIGLIHGLFDNSEHIPGLIAQRRSFGLLEARQRRLTDFPSDSGIAQVEFDARQQQPAKHALGEQGRWLEECQGALAEFARFLQPAVLVIHQGLVEIDGRDPGVVVLAVEELPRAPEEVQRDRGIAVVGQRDRQVGLRLGRLIAHSQLQECLLRAARQVGALFAQFQLEVHLGLIQIAERLPVGVAEFVAVLARRPVELDRVRVLAAQVVQIRDVVIGQHDQERHVVLHAVCTRLRVGIERVAERVEADLAGGGVLE